MQADKAMTNLISQIRLQNGAALSENRWPSSLNYFVILYFFCNYFESAEDTVCEIMLGHPIAFSPQYLPHF